MTQTKQLTVTQEDIDGSGGSGGALTCPFARAARRLFNARASVVGKRGSNCEVPADIFLHDTASFWVIDDAGGEAIDQYDHGHGMQPGTYTITLKDE